MDLLRKKVWLSKIKSFHNRILQLTIIFWIYTWHCRYFKCRNSQRFQLFFFLLFWNFISHVHQWVKQITFFYPIQIHILLFKIYPETFEYTTFHLIGIEYTQLMYFRIKHIVLEISLYTRDIKIQLMVSLFCYIHLTYWDFYLLKRNARYKSALLSSYGHMVLDKESYWSAFN